jgi:hypothetical protein
MLSKFKINFSWNFDVSQDTHDTWDHSTGECLRDSNANALKSQSSITLQHGLEPEIIFQRLPSKRISKIDDKFTYLKKIFDDEADES